MRIGVDLMGSDRSPSILFEAVEAAVNQLERDSVTLVVFATQATVDEILVSQPSLSPYIEFHVVSEIIHMTDEPLEAIRHKKDSSIVAGIRLLKKQMLDAFVSAGNTGALIAASTLYLPLFSTIRRPALLACLPTQKGSVAVIDVGGNVSCKSSHLIQFAQMGAAYQRCYKQIPAPRIGLLNIGAESKKGTAELRQTYQALHEMASHQSAEDRKIEFIGNIEGREVFQGLADVLVTDGFTGNVLLKTSEGIAAFIFDLLKESLGDSSTAQSLLSVLQLQHRFNYDEYPGAILCGVDSVVIKCHGQSSAQGMLNGIRGAFFLVKNNFVSQLKAELQGS